MSEHGCQWGTLDRNYPDTYQRLQSVSALDIITVLQADTTRGGADILGFAPEDVGTHYLLSGRATAMQIAGVLDITFMAIVQWRLLGFMVYIQQHISSFSSDVSVRMSQKPWFQHL